jgi:hypothetical protein
MSERTLRLRHETLADLTTDELAVLAGGSPTQACIDLRTVYCDTTVTFTVVITGCQCTAMVPSLNIECPTGRVCA